MGWDILGTERGQGRGFVADRYLRLAAFGYEGFVFVRWWRRVKGVCAVYVECECVVLCVVVRRVQHSTTIE